MEVEFDWDDDKNEANFLKHGICFEQVKPLFIQGNYEVEYDDLHSTPGEDRFIATGYVESIGGVVVVFCEVVEDVIRIISARLDKQVSDDKIKRSNEKGESHGKAAESD